MNETRVNQKPTMQAVSQWRVRRFGRIMHTWSRFRARVESVELLDLVLEIRKESDINGKRDKCQEGGQE